MASKVIALFRRATPQPPESSSNSAVTPPPIPPQSSNKNVALTVPNIPPPPVAPHKAFVKSKKIENDIAILSATYILEENPELKRLIRLIVVIHDRDEEDQVISYTHYAYRSLTTSSPSLSVSLRPAPGSASNLRLLPRPIARKPRRR